MYRHLLIATDGSRLSGKAVDHGIALAAALKARATLFYAAPEYPLPAYVDGVLHDPVSRQEYADLAARDAANACAPGHRKADAAGVPCDVVHAQSNVPWEAILTAARTSKCDAVVMGSHGRRGVSALLLGSETHKVLTHSKLPVIVVR
jgi:nucleotide-binding universal stress UspA family protein